MSGGGGGAPRRLDLTGVYPPIATPFHLDESIAWDKLHHNMAVWTQQPIRGFLVQGSNGEYCFLSPEERVEMIRTVKQYAGDKLVLAGSGCESTRATIQMTAAMAEAGADAAVVVTPAYFKAKMTGAVLEKHFAAVADASPIPVVLYSVPANTGIDLPVDAVARLSRHPNIVGMKDSGGDIVKIAELVAATEQEDFQVLAGSASFLLPALAVGAVGGICALANVLPAQVCELQRLFFDNNLDAAKKLQHSLIAPNSAVTKQFGVAGLKEAMSWFGYYGGPCRAPLTPLSPTESQLLKTAFRNFVRS